MNKKEPNNKKSVGSKKILKITILAIIVIFVIFMIIYGINNGEDLSQLTGGELNNLVINLKESIYSPWNY